MEVERNWRRLLWGVVLMLFGVLFLAERFGVMPPWTMELEWWPLIVIGLGLIKLIQPRRARDIGSSVMLTLMGLWFLAVSNDWYGLTWHNSWPLSLVAAGASMVAQSLAARWLPDTFWTPKENRHA